MLEYTQIFSCRMDMRSIGRPREMDVQPWAHLCEELHRTKAAQNNQLVGTYHG